MPSTDFEQLQAGKLMALQFYDFPMAPSPRRARIILAEKNVPHDTVIVDLTTEEQLGDAYKAINPSCTVPALKLSDGSVLTNNAGIAAYLEVEYPDPPLLGTSSIEIGMVAEWVSRIEMEGMLAVAEAMRNSSPGMKDRALTGESNWQQIPALAERGLGRLKLFFDTLNTHLEGREFVATDDFTLADIVALITVDFSRIVKVKPQEHHQNIVRWREGLNSRASVANN